MNGKDLLNGMNHVEDAYIQEAASGTMRKELPLGWISLAACLCLVVTVLLGIGGMDATTKDAAMEIQSNGSVRDDSEMALETENALGYGITYRYSIDQGSFATYVGGKVIEAEQIGEKIGDVTLTAGWQDNMSGDWQTREYLRGEVYEIPGVPQNVAVALRFLDKGDAVTLDHFYVILNPEADLSAVAEYVIPDWLPNHPGDE